MPTSRYRPRAVKDLTLDPVVLFCQAHRLPAPVCEHRFHPVRKWRFDYAWPEQRVALEQEGGVFIRGRHSRGVGMVNDMHKYAAATLLGWRVFRATPQMIRSGVAADWIRDALAQTG